MKSTRLLHTILGILGIKAFIHFVCILKYEHESAEFIRVRFAQFIGTALAGFQRYDTLNYVIQRNSI